jgi:hypothetical protein
MSFVIRNGALTWKPPPIKAEPEPGVGWLCTENLLHGLEEFFCSHCGEQRPQESAVEFAVEEVKKPDWQRSANRLQGKRKRGRPTNAEREARSVELGDKPVQDVPQVVVSKVRTETRSAKRETGGAVPVGNKNTRKSG